MKARSTMIVYLGLLLFVGCHAASNAEMIPLVSNEDELIAPSLAGDNNNNNENDRNNLRADNEMSRLASADSLLPTSVPTVLLAGLDFAKRPFYNKFLLQPTREISLANLLFNRGNLAAGRLRRNSFPAGNQSFIRFGRSRAKRPREAQETAFLRFGRSGQDGSKSSRAIYPSYILSSSFAPSSPSSNLVA